MAIETTECCMPLLIILANTRALTNTMYARKRVGRKRERRGENYEECKEGS